MSVKYKKRFCLWKPHHSAYQIAFLFADCLNMQRRTFSGAMTWVTTFRTPLNMRRTSPFNLCPFFKDLTRLFGKEIFHLNYWSLSALFVKVLILTHFVEFNANYGKQWPSPHDCAPSPQVNFYSSTHTKLSLPIRRDKIYWGTSCQMQIPLCVSPQGATSSCQASSYVISSCSHTIIHLNPPEKKMWQFFGKKYALCKKYIY